MDALWFPHELPPRDRPGHALSVGGASGRSTSTSSGCRTSWPHAGTPCSCWRRPGRARSCATRGGRSGRPLAIRNRCSAGRGDGPRHGPERSGAGTARGHAVAADRRRPHYRAGARQRAAGHPARARAVRAQRRRGGAAPLAGAERRHLPLAHRARALHPGRAALHRAVLRPPGCADAHASTATRNADQPSSPAEYDVVPARRGPRAIRAGRRPVRRAGSRSRSCIQEERGALRLFLRALRKLPTDARLARHRLDARGRDPPPRLGRTLRERVRFTGRRRARLEAAARPRGPAVRGSSGMAPAPALLLKAVAAGAVPVASRLPVYEEALRDGELRPAVRAAATPSCWRRSSRGSSPTRSCATRCAPRAASAGRARLGPGRGAARGRLPASRRSPPPGRGRPAVRRAAREPPLHPLRPAHAHGPLARLRDSRRRAARHRQASAGLGAIAVTDHNEISGAIEAHERARTGSR